MKFLGNKKLTVPLIIVGLIVSACLDTHKSRKSEPTKQEHKIDSAIIATVQLTATDIGYYVKE
jgi:hypothetical protein|tara:strand:- start:71 stop:259 length:189 start_codon:yes stop_codon:yes gene_type:complete